MLPFAPPLEPMLAKLSDTLPEGEGWLYEPKWDGFRVLVFRDRDDLFLQSRDGRPLLRYFPELEAPLLRDLPSSAVVDGEIVVSVNGTLDFDALQMRLHPAASRVRLLAEQTPSSVVAWDLLAEGDEDLRGTPFGERRRRLEVALPDRAPIRLTPATTDPGVARDWFGRFEGAGLDGVIAKRAEGTYEPGKRVMVKVKHQRTADCVVAGFRWHKHGPGELVGSLLLGLYDDGGRLHQVGVASSFKKTERKELAAELAPLREGAEEDHPWRAELDGDQRGPGGQSRWSQGRDLSWVPLRLERVAEVAYNQLTSGRFRHPAKLVRWRPDKRPDQCTYDQLEVATPSELRHLFG